MLKQILLQTIFVSITFLSAHAMASSGPNTVTCNACTSATDFWTYGAGFIEKTYGGAFAPFTRNDRIIVRNGRGTSYMVDVDSVTSQVCLIWCFSYDQRGLWDVKFQNLQKGSAKSVRTFIQVLREKFKKLEAKNQQVHLDANSFTLGSAASACSYVEN